VPLILSNLTVPLLGMVDTAVVGRLAEPHHLGAVALGAVAVNTLVWSFAFLRTATGGLTAQAFGAEDRAEMSLAPLRAALLAVVAAVLILAASPLFTGGALALFDPPPSTVPGLEAYLHIRLFGLPAIFLNHVAIGWFLGRQRPLVPLAMLTLANGLNAVLDVLFVLHWNFGVEGVAVATLIADHAALAIALVFARREGRASGRVPLDRARLLYAPALTRFFRLARDIFVRTLLMQVVTVGFAALGARQGELVLAANAVLLTFFALQAHGLDGFADATEAMTGRAVGRRSPDELRRAARAGFVNAGILASLLTLVFALAGPAVVDLLTTIEPVRETARLYLPYVVALPLLSVWAFVFDGIFFGATRGADMRRAMLWSVAGFGVAALLLTPAFGNHGLWTAFLFYMALRGLVLAAVYRRADRGAAFACP